MTRFACAWVLACLTACAPVDLLFGDLDAGDAGRDGGRLPCGGCGDGGVLVCDVDAGLCVQCVTDAQCSGPLAACEPTTHRCVECVSAAQCDAGESCAPSVHQCGLSCFQQSDCDDEGCGSEGICRSCDNDGDCGGEPKGPHCDVGAGRCVECLESRDCHDSAVPLCDRVLGKCVQCVTQTDCDAGQLCDPVGQQCRSR